MSDTLKKMEKRARDKGIPIEDVIQSYSTHLTKERRKLRDNPRQLESLKPATSYNLAVTQERTATGVRWRSLGGLPDGVDVITVTGSSMAAAKNKTSLRGLMEQRFRAELASALQRAGLYATDLEGRRAAMGVAIASPITVADLADV